MNKKAIDPSLLPARRKPEPFVPCPPDRGPVLRPGALDHLAAKSLQGGQMVAHRAPISMSSGAQGERAYILRPGDKK